MRALISILLCGYLFCAVSCSDQNPELLEGLVLSPCEQTPSVPAMNIAVIQEITANSVVIESSVNADCGATVTEVGFCLGTAANPDTGSNKLSTFILEDAFSVLYTDLEEDVVYHIRSYAINSEGISYSANLSFILGRTEGEQGPAGGLICYDKGEYSNGWRFLEVAPKNSEWSSISWGCEGTRTPSAEIGAGLNNTISAANSCNKPNTAINQCFGLNYNGYDDWFLPSRSELVTAYENLHQQGKGEFDEIITYWSSTDLEENRAFSVNFANGTFLNSGKEFGSKRARAFRRF